MYIYTWAAFLLGPHACVACAYIYICNAQWVGVSRTLTLMPYIHSVRVFFRRLLSFLLYISRRELAFSIISRAIHYSELSHVFFFFCFCRCCCCLPDSVIASGDFFRTSRKGWKYTSSERDVGEIRRCCWLCASIPFRYKHRCEYIYI